MKSRLDGLLIGIDTGADLIGVNRVTLMRWIRTGIVPTGTARHSRPDLKAGAPPFFKPLGAGSYVALRSELDTWINAYKVAITTGIQ